jgi:hypothetical protein
VKQFKARIENPALNWHAIEVYLQAENILDAGREMMEVLAPLGITTDKVTKLIEIDEPR